MNDVRNLLCVLYFNVIYLFNRARLHASVDAIVSSLSPSPVVAQTEYPSSKVVPGINKPGDIHMIPNEHSEGYNLQHLIHQVLFQ